jgi:lipoprotein-anchoring transpeptidase ErfK/SrfK
MNESIRWRQTNKARVEVLFWALILAAPAFAQAPEPSDAPRKARVAIVSIPDRKLAVMEDDEVIATFQVAVGAPVSPSPTGTFRIVSRVSNPTYYKPGTVIPSGKNNPIGTRWLGLDQKGYGIHGTNVPSSIGQAASHGCIRLRNRDVERLFTMLRTGDTVEIHGERDEQVVQLFGDGETEMAALPLAPAEGGQ